jgi:hypothetical protein
VKGDSKEVVWFPAFEKFTFAASEGDWGRWRWCAFFERLVDSETYLPVTPEANASESCSVLAWEKFYNEIKRRIANDFVNSLHGEGVSTRGYWQDQAHHTNGIPGGEPSRHGDVGGMA